MKRAKAYTDGSYNSALEIYGSGVVLILDGEEPILMHKTGKPEKGRNGWNVNGEIAAALMAVKKAKELGCTHLVIHHDYEGVGKWPDGEWKASKEYSIEYAKEIAHYRKGMNICFVHVKGHSGNHWNELADKEAKIGAGIIRAESRLSDEINDKTEKSPDGLTDAGRESLKIFLGKTKKEYHDFVILRSGGKDAYSCMPVSEMEPELGARMCREIKKDIDDPDNYIPALRWAMRGLSAEEAARKANIDTETWKKQEK